MVVLLGEVSCQAPKRGVCGANPTVRTAAVNGELPDYMGVQYYARFEHAGWHALLDWGDYREIPTRCGRVLSLWEGERVVEVGSGEQPVGLCAGCQDALLVQMPLL